MLPRVGGEVTRLLNRAQAGDRDAADRVLELLYGELRDIAGAQVGETE